RVRNCAEILEDNLAADGVVLSEELFNQSLIHDCDVASIGDLLFREHAPAQELETHGREVALTAELIDCPPFLGMRFARHVRFASNPSVGRKSAGFSRGHDARQSLEALQ